MLPIERMSLDEAVEEIGAQDAERAVRFGDPAGVVVWLKNHGGIARRVAAWEAIAKADREEVLARTNGAFEG